MNRLQQEQQRLFGTPLPHDASSGTRALMLELARPADWSDVVRLIQGVVEELALPAPAIAVSGTDGFQLWFSTQLPVPTKQAHAFLQGLCARYWPKVAAPRLRLHPTSLEAQADTCPAVPLQVQAGQWSAFVTPDLGALFADTPWLDAAPSPQAQAEVLAAVQSITPTAFAQAVAQLQVLARDLDISLPKATDATQPAVADARPRTGVGGGYTDPRHFLLDLMNDTLTPLRWRVEAAKALLNPAD